MTEVVPRNHNNGDGSHARLGQTGDHAELPDDERRKKFTGLKLDYLKCLMFDPDVPSWAFEIAGCIMNHVNAKTMQTMLSDEIISDETGISERTVRRARKLLRTAGWLDWDRTRTANVYKPLLETMNPMLDAIQVKRDARRERRQSRLRRHFAD